MSGSAGVIAVVSIWLAMLMVLTVRHVQLRRPAATKRRSSRLGLLLQAAGYAIAFGVRLSPVSPFQGGWGMPRGLAIGLALTLCATGAAIVIWSQQTLGVQWSLTARLVAEHRLVTTGPYAWARHPIYAAMMLMLAGTGIALTSPAVGAAALAISLAGSVVRVRAEEALMRDAFGAEWDAYRGRVRALIPGVL